MCACKSQSFDGSTEFWPKAINERTRLAHLTRCERGNYENIMGLYSSWTLLHRSLTLPIRNVRRTAPEPESRI